MPPFPLECNSVDGSALRMWPGPPRPTVQQKPAVQVPAGAADLSWPGIAAPFWPWLGTGVWKRFSMPSARRHLSPFLKNSIRPAPVHPSHSNGAGHCSRKRALAYFAFALAAIRFFFLISAVDASFFALCLVTHDLQASARHAVIRGD